MDASGDLPEFLVEYYMHMTASSMISTDLSNTTNQPLLSPSIEAMARALVDRKYIGQLCGCWLELLLLIPQIFQLGQSMLTPLDGEPHPPSRRRHHHIWLPPVADPGILSLTTRKPFQPTRRACVQAGCTFIPLEPPGYPAAGQLQHCAQGSHGRCCIGSNFSAGPVPRLYQGQHQPLLAACGHWLLHDRLGNSGSPQRTPSNYD